MSLENVYEFLKENKTEWFESKQISKALGIGKGSITVNLRKLILRGEVKKDERHPTKRLYRFLK